MNYDDPNLRVLLAGEYALGTLQGAARRRFEKLMAADLQLEAEVRKWEAQLLGLGEDTAPVAPPERVWVAVQSRLAPAERAPAAGPGFWRILALSASILSVVLAGLLLLPWARPPAPPAPADYVSVVRDDQARTVWVATFKPAGVELVLRAPASVPVAADKSLELWLLLEEGTPPVSLGLLPTSGVDTRPLTAGDLLERATGVAVSLEPAGGSPTGAPTGPVLYVAELLKLG